MLSFRSVHTRFTLASALVCGLACTAALACSGDSTAPGGAPSAASRIDVAAGDNASDTIYADLPQALRIVVRAPNGAGVGRAVVRLRSVPSSSTLAAGGPSVLVGNIATPGLGTFLSETTSTDGVILARVRLGAFAGAAAVAIDVPALGLTDTARYTVLPGNATAVVLLPADTTIRVGQTLALRVNVHDQVGNARTDTVSLATTDPRLTIPGTGTVSASVAARAAVVGHVTGGGKVVADTTWVSVVPAATVAFTNNASGPALFVASLDGTGVTKIANSQLPFLDPSPEWRPDGQAFLARLETSGADGGPFDLVRIDVAGGTQLLLSSGSFSSPVPGLPPEILSFSYSPDGTTLYVAASDCNGNSVIYRAPAQTPTAMEQLSPVLLEPIFNSCNNVQQLWPSPSPDGKQLVVESDSPQDGTPGLALIDLATKTTTELGIIGQRPRWSPAGDLIAYYASGEIWIVKPDGTGAHAITSSQVHYYEAGVSWSPDGRWLLANYGSRVALINVATGEEIPLPWTAGVAGRLMWKPAP